MKIRNCSAMPFPAHRVAPAPTFFGPRTSAMPRRTLRHGRAVVVTVFALGAVAFCGAPRGGRFSAQGRTAVCAEPDLTSEAWKETVGQRGGDGGRWEVLR